MVEIIPHNDPSQKEANFHLYENVEQKQYLFVRVVKAKDLVAKDVNGTCDPYVEVRLGNYKGTTRHIDKNSNPEWNQVFAVAMDRIKATMLEVIVKDKDVMKDDFIGWVLHDLCVVPKRVPPESPLGPKWCMLEDRKGNKLKGGLMLAVWWGTQSDEAFDAAASVGIVDGCPTTRSRVYQSPKLWYLRVNVIEAQDLIRSDRTRVPNAFVKAFLGNQCMRTKIAWSFNSTYVWVEEFMFVAAEPLEEPLIFSVEDQVASNKDEVLGRCAIPLQFVDRRLDDKAVYTRWLNLEQHIMIDGEKKKEVKFAGRIHMRITLEGGYHVFDESTHYCSDLRPPAKQLWKNSIGVLEVGILSANALTPMKKKDGREATDAYCVAKYGTKWIKTRTIMDSFTPKWNEHYTWEVYDPCTVITIGVFDNCHGAKDLTIGKVRIRLSTLETDRVYKNSYPLYALRPCGVEKTGEIVLAVRFKCYSLVNLMKMYTQPPLPKMHYTHPLTVTQLGSLSYQAAQIVSMRLSQAEPPLRKEVVDYMLDATSHVWSMRRSKANFFRLMAVLGGLVAVGKCFGEIYNWKNPINTVGIHIPFFILVFYPAFILPFVFIALSLTGVWNYRKRPIHPPNMDTRLSNADELAEEIDNILTSRPADIIPSEYGRVQSMVGDLATRGERLQSLLSWRDPRATAVFVSFCLIAAIVLYFTPLYIIIIQIVLCMLTEPWLLLSVLVNFFRRLPPRTDCVL